MKITKKLLREIIEEEVNTLILEKFGQVSPSNLKFFSQIVAKLGNIEWNSKNMAQRDMTVNGTDVEAVTAFVTFPGDIGGEIKLYIPKV